MTGTTYDFGEAFARLTCLLEDAAGLTSEGQSSQLDIEARGHLAAAVGNILHSTSEVLSEIGVELNR